MKRLREYKEKLLADKKLRLLLLLFCAGLALLLLSGTGTEKKTAKKAQDTYELRAAVESALESRLTKLLASVEGVGRVKVLVTLDGLERFVYAQDASGGGASERTESEFVTVEENGAKTGLLLSVISPEVRGVAVSCEGGGSARVRQEVVNLVCAALGIGASRVYVSKLS